MLDAYCQLNGCDIGEAKFMDAFNLECRTFPHRWFHQKSGFNFEQQELQQCYENSLQLAIDHHIHKISFFSIFTVSLIFKFI